MVPGVEKKLSKKRVMCSGKTFAPYGMKLGGPPPAVCKDFQPTESAEDLPPKVDLRNFMSPVEDQSQANSCCANAVAGAFEYINMRHCKKNGDKPADISRLFIYYVGRKRDQKNWNETGPVADDGMSIGGAITAMQTHGACMEADWPYDLNHVNKKPGEDCFKAAQQFKVLEATRIPVDLDFMRQTLAEGHPIVFGLKLTQRFFNPRQGYCAKPDPNDPQSASHGLHAMLIVGYNDRQSIFIVRNSWGTSWGDRGYGYVPYDYIANVDFNIGDQYAIKGLSEVDFTPDDDDGADVELPGDDAGEDDDMQSFDMDDLEPPGDEDDDDIQIDEEFLESLKNTWFYHDNKMPKQMFIQIGVMVTNGGIDFMQWLLIKLKDDGDDTRFGYDDLRALLKEFQDQQ